MGRLQALGRSEYGLHHLRPGWVEQSPEDWWQAVCLATRQALGAIPNGADSVLGLAVSSQAPALLPLSRTGAPLRPAMIWMDRRAEAEVKQLDEILGEGTILPGDGQPSGRLLRRAEIALVQEPMSLNSWNRLSSLFKSMVISTIA